LNERVGGGEKEKDGWRKWGKKKAEEFRGKMREQKNGQGVFKRGVC